MRSIAFSLLLLFPLLLTQASADDLHDRFDRAVKQLRSDDPAERDKGSAEIEAITKEAPELVKSLADDKDPEVKGRLLAVLNRVDIEKLRGADLVPERQFTLEHGSALAVAFSPKGDLFATAGECGEILIWDLATKRSIATIEPRDECWVSLAFDPSGTRLLGSSWNELAVWEVSSQKLLAHRRHEARCSAAWSPDGKWLAWVAEDGIVLADASTYKIKTTLEHPDNWGVSVVFSPDSTQLAVAASGKAFLLDLKTGSRVDAAGKLPPDVREVDVVAFFPDGRLALGGLGQVTWGAVHIENPSAHHVLAISPDGKQIASIAEKGQIKIWNTAGEVVESLEEDLHNSSALAWSTDSRILASAGGDGVVRLWTGKHAVELSGHRGVARRLAFSPDGSCLAAAGTELDFLNVADGTVVRSPRPDGNRDDQSYVSPGSAGNEIIVSRFERIEVWNGSTGKALRGLGKHKFWSFDYPVALSPDGKIAAFYGGLAALVLHPVDEDSRIEMPPEYSWMTPPDVAWRPNGKEIAVAGRFSGSGGDTYSLVVFDANGEARYKSERVEEEVRSVTYSPSGKHLVWGGLKEIHVLDAGTFEEIRSHATTTQCFRYFDENLAVSAGWRSFSLWHAPSLTRLKVVPLHRPMWPPVVSAKGERVAVQVDGIVRVFRLKR